MKNSFIDILSYTCLSDSFLTDQQSQDDLCPGFSTLCRNLCEFLSLPQENPLDIDILLKLVYHSSPLDFFKMLGSLYEEEVLYSRREILKQKETIKGDW